MKDNTRDELIHAQSRDEIFNILKRYKGRMTNGTFLQPVFQERLWGGTNLTRIWLRYSE